MAQMIFNSNSVLRLCTRREPVSRLSVAKRVDNFREVDPGYGEEEVRREASRCLQCEDPPCVEACPAHVNIKQYVFEAAEGRYREGLDTILEKLPLPCTCGRVCPHPCEDACVRHTHFEPIAIRTIKRFLADRFMEEDWYGRVETKLEDKIAVVGAGPAGLTVARNLALLGYMVTVFDAGRSGGMLSQSLPDYRLPTQYPEKEVGEINRLGVKFERGKLGEDLDIKTLFEKGYKAVFLGLGTQLGMGMNLPGEELEGVYDALDLLKSIKMGETVPRFQGKQVIVVGGGNVAMDTVRTIRRLGGQVSLVYRRSWEEMPAEREEIEEANEEGVEFNLLTNPTGIFGNGKVQDIECVKMELGEPDSSGRRRPVPIEDSRFRMPADFVVEAIGQGPEPEMLKSMGIDLGRRGLIKVDDDMMTSIGGVFAAGDAVTGPRIVIEAVAGGAKAAESINKYCMSKT